jgi:hypothetical protein
MARKLTILHNDNFQDPHRLLLQILVKDHEKATYSLATLERMMVDELALIALRWISGK